MSDVTIVYRYDATLDPQYREDSEYTPSFLMGIPLRDLTADDVSALAKWQRASIEAAPYYIATLRDPLPLDAETETEMPAKRKRS